MDTAGGGFTLLLFDDNTPADLQAVADGATGLPLAITCVPATAADGQAWARYGVQQRGAAYLVRPDQHVCARWLRVTPQRLQTALQRAHGL